MDNPRILSANSLSVFQFKDLIIPVSQDTYDETAILKSVQGQNATDLFACAVQCCIVGTGGKSYGKVKINEIETECKELLIKNNVLLENKKDAKLKPEDLTLRRICRLFRHQIHNYIIETKRYSYLYRKYCRIKCDPTLVFPGAEHLVDTVEAAKVLLHCYENIDTLKATQFVLRIRRVFLARGLMIE